MKKKIIIASVLSWLAFNTTPVFATESIAMNVGVYPTCTGCHTNANINTASNGNLKVAAKNAYKKSGLAGLRTFLAGTTTLTCTLPQVLNAAKTACITPTPTCTLPQVLNASKTACITPTPTCTLPQVLNAAKTACITPTPLTCVAPKVLNAAQTACVNPPAMTCVLPEVLNTTKDACIAQPVCSDTEVLNAAKNACITKPTTSTKNTKPILNAVTQQWDVQVGELLSIPLSVNDAEQDEFKIVTSKLVGSTLGEIYQNDAGFPTVNFEWTPTTANVNKIQAITFQAKETATKQKYASNKVSVKVRVWAAGDRDAASITKLNVMTSKFSAGNLKLAGNVKFNGLLTATERQAFIDQALTLNVSDVNGSIYAEPLTLTKTGAWSITIPLTSVSCDNITLEFAGQSASRKVVGCLKTAQTDNTDNLIAANDDDNESDNHNDNKSNKKHDD